jgi:hypothetical protein
LPPVSLTPVANLELRISQRIFEKIRNGPNGIEVQSEAWGKPIQEKTRSKKSRDTVPLSAAFTDAVSDKYAGRHTISAFFAFSGLFSGFSLYFMFASAIQLNLKGL